MYRDQVTSTINGNEVTLSKTCTVTGNMFSVKVDRLTYERWRNKELLIQNAFPDLEPPTREFIISGTTPAEWEEMFGTIED